MRVARVKVSAGRPDEFGNDGTGYAPNGESAFTRASAHGDQRMSRLPSAKTARRVSRGQQLPLPTLIAETQQGVQWIEAQLRIEDDPTRKAKLRKNLEIKSAFLTRLRRELNLGVRL
jgi:hypothetical protein